MNARRLNRVFMPRILGPALAVSMVAWAELPTGRIEGKLQTESGEPVVGAVVTAAPRQAPADGSLGRPFQAISGADGTFVLPQVPANVYWICANLAGSQLLDPCSWSAEPPSVDISDGSTRSEINIILQQGAFAYIRVQDAKRALQIDKKTGRASSALMIGVFGPRGMARARQVLDDDQGHTFRILVPFDTPLQLQINPGQLQMADRAGKPLAGSDLKQPFTIKKQDPPTTFDFSIQVP